MSDDRTRQRGGPTGAQKVRELGLRRKAERQNLRLERCRRRDPRAAGYGLYRLVPLDAPPRVEGAYTLTLEEAARELGEDDRARTAA